MRRPARRSAAVLAALALAAAPVLAGTALADPGGRGAGQATAASAANAAGPVKAAGRAKPVKPVKPAKAAKPAKPAKAAKPARTKVVVVGVIASTATVSTSGTSTVTLVLRVKGGAKEHRGATALRVTVDAATVVTRTGRATRFDLRTGDKVTVHAVRGAAGMLTATRVSAAARG